MLVLNTPFLDGSSSVIQMTGLLDWWRSFKFVFCALVRTHLLLLALMHPAYFSQSCCALHTSPVIF